MLDWGDDPSFFAATERLGSPNSASWGVCRRDVRAVMQPGDYVVFFRGREQGAGEWHYFYVGVGTVGRCLSRHDLWTAEAGRPYREFFNVLARYTDGHLHQEESIYRFHDDWEARASAPYILFDPDATLFNLDNPLHVASYRVEEGGVERWRAGDPRIERLRELVLPPEPTRRRLRSVNVQRSHPKMNLALQGQRAGGLHPLRDQLLALLR
jgi:hypothetical protein